MHEKVIDMGHGQRVLGGFAAACVAVATLVAGAAGATPATAAACGDGTTVGVQPLVVDAGGLYAGTEGDAITFTGSASGGCTTPSLHWQFSDGGTADGATPSRVFADDGVYTGSLTATDGVQSATAAFVVFVDNAGPVVDAGPEVATPAGVPVSLVGTATDPSSVDQGSLQYLWEFADGTASATGASVTHVFALPGTYDVTLTVCDKNGGCGFDTRRVTVSAVAVKQPTLIAYYGDFIGRTGGTTNLRAILVDRNLQPLPGRTVTFTLGAQTATAVTDARGIATTKLKITQRLGLYAVTASWRQGDTQYAGSSMTLAYLVLR